MYLANPNLTAGLLGSHLGRLTTTLRRRTGSRIWTSLKLGRIVVSLLLYEYGRQTAVYLEMKCFVNLVSLNS